MENENTVQILGVDMGAGAVKIAGPGRISQTLSQISTPNTQRLTAQTGLLRSKAPNLIEGDFGRFYVGANAHHFGRPVEALDHERFAGKPDVRALLYGALTAYLQQDAAPGLTPPAFKVWVGLPLEPLSGPSGAANKSAAESWMRGRHAWRATRDNGKSAALEVDIVESQITSQATAAYFDAVLDDAGRVRNPALLKSEVGVISLGFNTLELFVVENRAPVESFSVSVTSGVRRLLELTDPEQHYSLGELDIRLRDGVLDTKTALPIWLREVERHIERQWGRAHKRFNTVIVVGGGAVLLGNALTARFNGRAVVPEEPVFAIARGLRKIGLAKTSRKQQ